MTARFQPDSDLAPVSAENAVDVSIVMPCLNEARSLEFCIRNAQEALAELAREDGLRGEIVIADNGSSDGSQGLASHLGARVMSVAERGYGTALRAGFHAAKGQFLVMGDADGSYDFRESVPMVRALIQGAGLCMGSRRRGLIKPGAMPWKNRYIGNPVLTAVLNILFGTKVTDAHCGLRALTRSCFDRLKLTGSGMEFASEMLLKAALKGETIAETPATLSPDLRGRPPHLRPWRDGWRHLRYLFMLSPSALFAVPAALGAAISLAILLMASYAATAWPPGTSMFGNYWVILAASLLSVSHIAALLALAAHLYGVREGYRNPGKWTPRLSRWVTLETMLVAGAGSFLAGLAILTAVVVFWSARSFEPTYSVFPAVIAALFMTLGTQNALGGFILAIVNGNDSRFLNIQPAKETPPAQHVGVPRALEGLS